MSPPLPDVTYAKTFSLMVELVHILKAVMLAFGWVH
jgi:hypothetical protein